MVQERWVKPPFQTIKVNCDGAWCSRMGIGGFRWVARDFIGIFHGAGGVGGVLCGSSLLAEVEAVRWGLLACMERGYGMVQIETDSKMLVEMLNGLLLPEGSIEGILWDIEYSKKPIGLCGISLYSSSL
ncbi:hypothetical protein D8674_000228 [Pyrus ussuriensis x Pyrus communis]|uniref:RNase H type-1 domain-containing protein n=1 Tax=Pyrus ussuriensis x Pyrus communis TaxID=2448454 RepID=A0A5N5F2I7_9ROSA|nr:hypothetical protein D8674_000228 [Pyrus ussuriensis x Pyrus communis]